jgi:sulfur-oxidizing protein SoxY
MTLNPKAGASLSRRSLIAAAAAGGCGALAAWLVPLRASATPEQAQKLIASFGPAAPKDGKITLGAPEIAENGATVPITISVESPMTEQDYVTSILLVADGNPLPGVARFELTPANGVAKVEIRIRLAQTQTVTAVAAMSDGSLWKASKTVKVTIGGCGG